MRFYKIRNTLSERKFIVDLCDTSIIAHIPIKFKDLFCKISAFPCIYHYYKRIFAE